MKPLPASSQCVVSFSFLTIFLSLDLFSSPLFSLQVIQAAKNTKDLG